MSERKTSETMIGALAEAFFAEGKDSAKLAGFCAVCAKECAMRLESACLVLPPNWCTVEAVTKRRYVNFFVCSDGCKGAFDDMMFDTLAQIVGDPQQEKSEGIAIDPERSSSLEAAQERIRALEARAEAAERRADEATAEAGFVVTKKDPTR